MRVFLYGPNTSNTARVEKILDKLDFQCHKLEGASLVDLLRGVSSQGSTHVPLFLIGGKSLIDLDVNEIRKIHPEILIIVAGVDRREEVATLFSLGVDEVLTTDMSESEYRARTYAAMRRARGQSLISITFDRLTVFLDGRAPRLDGNAIQLTPSEQCIMTTLASQTGKPTPRDVLYAMLFAGSDNLPYERIVDVHISNIRKKLEAVGGTAAGYIKTYRGKGYMLEVPA